MPRPISWLPRLYAIRKTVAGSVRSHYGRQDLEALFGLQPRAAQKLFELLPMVQVGTARLVETSALAAFLNRVNGAEDVKVAIDESREEKHAVSRRALRTLVRTDHSPATLFGMPDTIILEPGRLEVRFRTLMELAERMYYLARMIDAEGDAMAMLYELPETGPENSSETSSDVDSADSAEAHTGVAVLVKS